jgi:hypothetical protein
MQETAAASTGGARLLRDSFAGLNARFHLVGIYTLLGLLLKITETLDLRAPELAGLALAVMFVFHGAVCGIRGLVYHAAAGRGEPPSFGLYATILFLPLFWLTLKIVVIVLGAAGAGAAIYHAASGSPLSIEATVQAMSRWGEPITGFVTRLLWLYSIPICIEARLAGRWRTSIRDGLRPLRAFPSETRRLVTLLAVIAALDAGLLFARPPAPPPAGPDVAGPGAAGPDVAGVLVLLAQYYLELAALFGATRVLALREARGDRGEARPDGGRPAPGTPA